MTTGPRPSAVALAALPWAFVALASPFVGAQVPSPTFADVPYGALPDEKLDVYLAPGSGAKPVVIEFHPGGWFSGSKSQFSHYGGTIEKLLAKGISIVSVDYPLAPGHVFPQQNLSCQRAVQYVRSQAESLGLDKSKVGALGISAGAQLALWVALSPDAANPASPDPVERESSRLRFVVDIQGPTDFTSQYYKHDVVNFPEGSEVWHYFGAATEAEFDAIPLETKQLASPHWLVQNGAGAEGNRLVGFLGVYGGLPTTQSSSQCAAPVSDPHSLLFGLLQLEAMQAIGAIDASIYISPYVAPSIGLLPAADVIATWCHLRFLRAKASNDGFGVPGCVATQFQLCSGAPMTGAADFQLLSFDCFPGSIGLTWISDAPGPAGGVDYFGVGLPLLVDPFSPNLFGLDAFALSTGVGGSPLPIPDESALKGLTFYVQTAWLWPTPALLGGCTPSPLQLSTTNLLRLTIQ